MSQDNLDVVRSSFAAWNRGDVEAFAALYAQDAEWDMTRFSGWPEDTRSDSVKSFFEDMFTAFEGIQVEAERLVEVGSDQVFAYARMEARGKGSGVPVGSPAFWQLCTVRGGKILHVITYSDQAEALADAGLQEKRRPSARLR
jgi:ketosteroid isomerase-like protein